MKIGLPKAVWVRIKSILVNSQVRFKALDLRSVSREKRLLIEDVQFFLYFFSRNPDTFFTTRMRLAKNCLAQIHLLISIENPYPSLNTIVEKKKFLSSKKIKKKDKGKFGVTSYSKLKIVFSLSNSRTLSVCIDNLVDMNLAGEFCYLSYGRLVIPQQNKVLNVMSWHV